MISIIHNKSETDSSSAPASIWSASFWRFARSSKSENLIGFRSFQTYSHHQRGGGNATRTNSSNRSLAATVDSLYESCVEGGLLDHFSRQYWVWRSALSRLIIHSQSSPGLLVRFGVSNRSTVAPVPCGTGASFADASFSRNGLYATQTSGRTGESCVKRRPRRIPNTTSSISCRLNAIRRVHKLINVGSINSR